VFPHHHSRGRNARGSPEGRRGPTPPGLGWDQSQPPAPRFLPAQDAPFPVDLREVALGVPPPFWPTAPIRRAPVCLNLPSWKWPLGLHDRSCLPFGANPHCNLLAPPRLPGLTLTPILTLTLTLTPTLTTIGGGVGGGACGPSQQYPLATGGKTPPSPGTHQDGPTASRPLVAVPDKFYALVEFKRGRVVQFQCPFAVQPGPRPPPWVPPTGPVWATDARV